jgi:hypothetical protein
MERWGKWKDVCLGREQLSQRALTSLAKIGLRVLGGDLAWVLITSALTLVPTGSRHEKQRGALSKIGSARNDHPLGFVCSVSFCACPGPAHRWGMAHHPCTLSCR